jgi:enterochelin esterase family protein
VSGEAHQLSPLAFRGRAEVRVLASELLAGNRAGDPVEREVSVYLPPGWDAPGAGFPVLYVLAGFTGRGQKYLETHPWKPGFVLRYDRQVAAGEAPPAILVLPDFFTCMGGSQYVDSAYLGPYERHLTEELVPFVDEHWPTLPGRRGIVGKSSGGFGAMRLSMRHPELFPAVASISGDVDFELCHAHEFPAAMRGLLDFDMDPARFLEEFHRTHSLSGDGHAVINTLAMSACYSPNPDSPLGFDLPFDLETGARLPEVWERWLAFDPLAMVAEHADAWRRLELLHLECGLKDEFHLQWGLRNLVRRLDELDVPHRHVEHPGGHMGIDDRYLEVLPDLVRVLAG